MHVHVCRALYYSTITGDAIKQSEWGIGVIKMQDGVGGRVGIVQGDKRGSQGEVMRSSWGLERQSRVIIN